MLDALKRMDKKFLIIAGVIVCLPILLIVFLAVIQGCGNHKLTYEEYEKKMISSFEKYLNDKKEIPDEESEYVTISLEKLVKNEYIKSPEDLLDDTSCKGTVGVRRNGSSIEKNNGGFLNYTVNLECDNYSTVHFVDKIKENVVTDGTDGLYLVGEEYIFKGSEPKNHIQFYGLSYRIVSMDKDGMLKLVRSEPELTTRLWDNKYNVDVNANYGKNIYKDSAMLNVLLKDYENVKIISKDAKQHVVAYDVCIGKRSNSDYSISREIDCSEILDNQVVSILNISDYALASLDPDCNSLRAKSCNNYNYLSKVARSTWTLNTSSEDSYRVFYVSSGLAAVQEASVYNEYNIVIYIDGNELYTEGSGSEFDPYVIKES